MISTKNQKKRLFTLIFAFVFALSVSASAINIRASYYLDKYEINAVSIGRGEIAIRISVDGTGRMSELGAEEMTIYEKFNGRWVIAGYFDKNDDGMTGTNTSSFINTIYFNGYEDLEYKVCVTIFAEDSTGSDSRNLEVYVNT